MSTSHKNISFHLAVCTCKRTKMLQACLSSIAQIHIPENIIFSAIVIDNDEQPNAKYIVDGFREVLPFDIIYYHEPNPGIPQARNAALKIALEENTDFLGFIDDDEKVAQNWLVEIMKVFNAYQCDIVQGRVHFEYKEAIPLLNFKKKQKTRKTGDRLRTASTDNVVMKKKIFAPNPDGLNLRFNEDMRYTGGSDTEFFSGQQILEHQLFGRIRRLYLNLSRNPGLLFYGS